MFAAELDRIAAVCERERLGVSTAAIAAAARQRGIPVRRVAAGACCGSATAATGAWSAPR